MKPKKTISNWLTSRYQLVIRNEENFAEKTSVGFTYSKVILFSVILFSVIFIISLFLSKTLLAKWFDPRHAQIEMNRQLVQLKDQFDSLAIEVDRKDQFILNFQRVLSGDTSEFKDPAEIMRADTRQSPKPAEHKIEPTDSTFRKEFEKSDLSLVSLTSVKYRELQETFFFSPITGFISDRFDLKRGHHGVDVVAKTNEAVKNVADGSVIFASWTQDAGYVIMIQHRGNLISVYKHNAELLKKVGTFVNAGEIISIVGNSGEMTDGPHLHFELWYNGNPLNPEDFVTF
ncbi:MAG TPA: M23 family metallopeptidase [Cyclobacteriaceae bacterium]|nr:M23 family metallopeptidase [Cyclobacteriaceae bacterium]